MRVTVIGTGYVGTVTGACLAYWDIASRAWTPTRARSRSCGAAKCPSTSHAWRNCCNWRRRAAASTLPLNWRRPRRRATSSSSRWGRLRWPDGRSQSLLSGSGRAQHRGGHGRRQVPRGGEQVHRSGGKRQPGGHAGAGGHWGGASGRAEAHPFRRGQQSGVPAGRQRHRRFALSGPHRAWRRGQSARCRCMRELYGPLVEQSFEAPPDFCRARPACGRCRW